MKQGIYILRNLLNCQSCLGSNVIDKHKLKLGIAICIYMGCKGIDLLKPLSGCIALRNFLLIVTIGIQFKVILENAKTIM